MNKKSRLAAVVASLSLGLSLGCDPQPEDNGIIDDRTRVPAPMPEAESDPYTPEMLAEYKRALPTTEMVKAPQPESQMDAQVGDPALFPRLAAPQVMAVNLHVIGLVTVLDLITDLPPTAYNSDTKEFVWGPWDDDESALQGDKVMLYIRDAGETADLRYHYAFIRGMGNDMATYQPVIYGAGQPGDGEDYLDGLAVYDFEANAAFEDAHNPDHGAIPAGRVAVLFTKRADENNPDNDVAVVLSTFRDFQGADMDESISFEQLYGHVDGADGNKIDFVDIDTEGNVTPEDEPDSAREDISLRIAMVNGGAGRAEALVDNGDLAGDNGGSVVTATECWGGFLGRRYLQMDAHGELAADAPDGVVNIVTEGSVDLCVGPFTDTLDDLDVPSLEDVDADLLAGLDELATNGLVP
jgi:hypothetical protein